MTPVTSKRRLLGLDRSGPRPNVTMRGQPLRPLTIPNLVGYVRLAGIPVFLYLALRSGDGRTASAAIVYMAIAASDYLDGFLARATGQYSRLGALLDPLVDRLTVLAGVVVCWKFELLPRWALAVRWSVWLTMGGIFLALVTPAWIAPAMFFVGLVGSLLASVLYLRTGLAALRRS